ncbi:uncharacterized protein BCR38DRAFT_439984 [Pseudomassariella vexata]|uniref:Cupin type-1 domain-containing protein n=1 Tax=Pseudomassariella vexata TaxID=1141098 RepID=A0A1Y2DQA6_9PEZI|nr:uncharacterized protein BCR38DRAFT_439984 [Pseudomassariella vexata]ORY61369.1 hypothetical protein BCR38DRAFT_439984 [Pseudomassariella vexata]
MVSMSAPEQYHIKPTPHCPNNRLPVLVYRGVLPTPLDEGTASEALQLNGWVKKGTWGTITVKHFHPNTHECYGIFQGASELVFGEGGADESGKGIRCHVRAGDVVVVPAGVAHASVATEEEGGTQNESGDGHKPYKYIGVYPEGAPHWRSELGNRMLSSEDEDLTNEVASVAAPSADPVYGPHGPLMDIWGKVTKQ